MSFEKCCDFHPNNYKFCAVEKYYKYVQRHCTEIWKCYSKHFRKNEKWDYKMNKLKLKIGFLNNWKQLCVYSKFLIFKLPNVSNKEALSIRKRLLCSAINKHNKELQDLSKELSLSENLLSTQLSTIDFYILAKSITSYNKNSLQK